MLPHTSSVVADGKDGDGLQFEKSLRQNQKCTMKYSSIKKTVCCLVLNLKPMFSARAKVSKKDFCIVLGGKQQKCRDRAPLSVRRIGCTLLFPCWSNNIHNLWRCRWRRPRDDDVCNAA